MTTSKSPDEIAAALTPARAKLLLKRCQDTDTAPADGDRIWLRVARSRVIPTPLGRLVAGYLRQAELELQVEDAKRRRSWPDLSRLREELDAIAREHGL